MIRPLREPPERGLDSYKGGEMLKLLKGRYIRIFYSAGALIVLAILLEAGRKVPGGGGH
jgi:hypothetical protein